MSLKSLLESEQFLPIHWEKKWFLIQNFQIKTKCGCEIHTYT